MLVEGGIEHLVSLSKNASTIVQTQVLIIIVRLQLSVPHKPRLYQKYLTCSRFAPLGPSFDEFARGIVIEDPSDEESCKDTREKLGFEGMSFAA